jgi:hypothetical protein
MAVLSIVDIRASEDRARRRLSGSAVPTGRRPRSDRGKSRLDARVLTALAEAASGYDRPLMSALLTRLDERCRQARIATPSRATLYKILPMLPTPRYRAGALPPPVRQALYNLTAESDVPATQVVFYCFNYGDTRAMSFAAGLPWLALYQALRLPGYRSKSRGLLEAVARVRGV